MHVQRAVSLKNTIIKEKYHRAWLASAILKEKTDNLKNTKRKTSTRTSNFSNLEVTSINRHICLNLQENRKKKKRKQIIIMKHIFKVASTVQNLKPYLASSTETLIFVRNLYTFIQK